MGKRVIGLGSATRGQAHESEESNQGFRVESFYFGTNSYKLMLAPSGEFPVCC